MNEKAHAFWQRVLSRVSSQQELARKTGIQRGTISTQISGQRFPKLEDTLKIAQALNANVEDLVGLEYKKENTSLTSMADISDRLDVLKHYTARSINALLKSPLTYSIKEMHELVKTLEKMIYNYAVALPLIEQYSHNRSEGAGNAVQELGPATSGTMYAPWEIPEKTHAVAARFVPSGHQQEYFVFRVSENSMVNHGIENASYCLIRKVNSADFGQVVVVRDGDSFSVKQFVRDESGRSMLAYHDGSNRKIICTPQMKIVGVFVQVLPA